MHKISQLTILAETGPQKIQRYMYYHNANIAASQVLVCVHGLVITVPLTLGIASNCLTCDNVYN